MTTNGRRAPQWPLLLLLLAIVGAGIQQTRSTIVLYLVALICAFVAVQSRPPIIYVAMFGLGLLLIIHLLGSLHNAYSVTPFRRLANLTRKLRSNSQPEPLSLNTGPTNNIGCASAATLPPAAKMKLYGLHALATVAADTIDKHVKRKIFELYLIASWLFTVTL